MAIYVSEREAYDEIRQCEAILRRLRQDRISFDRRAASLEDQGQLASTVNTSLSNLLTDWAALRSEVITTLTGISSTFQFRVKIGQPGAYDGAWIVASDAINNGYGTLRVRAAQESTISPFTLFQAGDRIRISNAEDSDYNGAWTLRYTPQPLGGSIITDSTFATNWTTTNWVVSGGFADHTTGNTSALSQSYAAMTGEADNTPYLLRFTISDMTAGSITATFDSAHNSRTITYASAASNATYEVVVYSDSGSSLTFTPTSDFDGKISAPSLTPWTGLAFSGGIGIDTVSNTFDSKVIVTIEER